MRQHNLSEPTNYEIIQIASQGSILNVDSLDLGCSTKTVVITVVQSYKAHLVQMSRSTFEKLNRDQQKHEKEMLKHNLNQNILFKALSENTQH